MQEEQWIKVAAGQDESWALLIKGLLDEASIPVLIQRGKGFDAPEFLSAGPRDVLVPNSLVAEAKELLEETVGLGSWV